jgi:hypothetical protein
MTEGRKVRIDYIKKTPAMLAFHFVTYASAETISYRRSNCNSGRLYAEASARGTWDKSIILALPSSYSETSLISSCF